MKQGMTVKIKFPDADEYADFSGNPCSVSIEADSDGCIDVAMQGAFIRTAGKITEDGNKIVYEDYTFINSLFVAGGIASIFDDPVKYQKLMNTKFFDLDPVMIDVAFQWICFREAGVSFKHSQAVSRYLKLALNVHRDRMLFREDETTKICLYTFVSMLSQFLYLTDSERSFSLNVSYMCMLGIRSSVLSDPELKNKCFALLQRNENEDD